MYRSLVVPLAIFIGLPACAAGEGTHPPRAALTTPGKVLPGGVIAPGNWDPMAFAEWLEAMAEPRMMTTLGAVATPTGSPPKLAANAIDPGTIRNWAEFTDPYLFMRWALAGGTPAFRLAIDSRTTVADNPKRMNPANAAAACGAFAGMMRFTPIHWPGVPSGRSGQPVEAGGNGWLRLPSAGEAGAASARHRF